MGIRFSCPNGHKLNVKESLAGKRALCPECGAKIQVPDPPQSAVAASVPTSNMAMPESPAAPDAWPAIADAAAPSIVIALDAPSASVTTQSTPSPQLPPSVPPPAPTPPALDLPASIIQTPPVSVPEPLAPDVQHQIRRERRRRNQAIFAVVLLIMVLALGITLVWVLWRNAHPAPPPSAEPEPPAKTGSLVLPRPTDFAGKFVVPQVRMRSERL